MQNQFMSQEPLQPQQQFPVAISNQEQSASNAIEGSLQIDGRAQQAQSMVDAAVARLRRRQRYLRNIYLFYQVVSVLFALVFFVFPMSLALMQYVLVFALGSLAAMLLAAPRARDLERLGQQGAVRAIGPLLDILGSSVPMRNKVIYATLTVLLPQLKASDANLLTPKQRNTLLNMIGGGRVATRYTSPWSGQPLSPDLQIAILKAFEQIGDETAIGTVERLASRRAWTRQQRRLKAAAQECLPLLKANASRVAATQTLLRASGPTSQADEAAQTLLRGAMPAAHPDQPRELLRPSDIEPS